MGFSSEQGRACKKHSAHEDKQGICPSCLSDRLFHLNHAAGEGDPVSSFSDGDKAAAASSSSSSSSDDDYHDVVDNENVEEEEEEEEEKKNHGAGHTHRRSASSSEIYSMSFRAAAPVGVPSGRGNGGGGECGGNAGLKKSRSVAASYSFAPQPPKAIRRGGERVFSDENCNNHGYGYGNGGGGGKKKKGFWTKLLHLKGKNKEVLVPHPAMAAKGRAH